MCTPKHFYEYVPLCVCVWQPQTGNSSMLMNRWIDKQSVVFLYNEILLGSKTRVTTNTQQRGCVSKALC